MTRLPLWPLVGVALMLGGCLLPQPDTPVIPPMAGPQSVNRAQPQQEAAPVAAPTSADTAAGGEGLISNNAGGLVSNSAGGMSATSPTAAIAPASPGAPAVLSGTITGMTVKTIVAVPELDGDGAMDAQFGADGAFSLSLPEGHYFLELMLDDAQRLRVEKRIDMVAGEARAITLTLSATPPKATLTEEAPLSTPSTSPSPSAAP
jgi:hypothetical protein